MRRVLGLAVVIIAALAAAACSSDASGGVSNVNQNANGNSNANANLNRNTNDNNANANGNANDNGNGNSNTDPGPCALASPGAPWLTFVSRRAGNYDVYIARSDGTCEQQVTSDPGDDLYPTWAPDRSKIAFMSARGGFQQIWIHDLATGAETALDTGDLRATSPSWSPDGASIAFEARPSSGMSTNVYAIPAGGGTPVNLSNVAADNPCSCNTAYVCAVNAGPRWAPDGSKVYFVSTRDCHYDVYTVPAAGDTSATHALTQRVTTGVDLVGRPAVSPDGKQLAYARGSSTTEIVTFDLATQAVHVVSSTLADCDSEPAWDPTGTRLAERSFRSAISGTAVADLYVVDLNDTVVKRLTADVASDGAPEYAPAP